MGIARRECTRVPHPRLRRVDRGGLLPGDHLSQPAPTQLGQRDATALGELACFLVLALLEGDLGSRHVITMDDGDNTVKLGQPFVSPRSAECRRDLRQQEC
jgi:hypothetical protein